MTSTLTADEIKNITRFEIYNLYVKTHSYLHPKEFCEKNFKTLNRDLLCHLTDNDARIGGSNTKARERIINKYEKLAISYLVDLQQQSQVPHKLVFTQDEYKFEEKLIYQESFPLINPPSRDIPLTINLTFDLCTGWKQQADEAKRMSNMHIMKYRHNHPDTNHLFAGTTRRTLNHIYDGLKVLVKREADIVEELTWNATCRKLNLADSTARYRYKTAKTLIESGEIRKFFPRFG